MIHRFEKNFISLLLVTLLLFSSVSGMSFLAFADDDASKELAEPVVSAGTESASDEVEEEPTQDNPAPQPEPSAEPQPEPDKPSAEPEKPAADPGKDQGSQEDKEKKKEDTKQDKKKEDKKQEAPKEEHTPYDAPWLSSSDIPISDDELIVLITFFREELKLNKAALAGMLANIHRESAYDYVKVGDYGNAFGLCQWRSDRLDMLVAYCDENDLNPVTLEGQLAYLLYEIQTYYPNLCIYFECCEETEYDAAWAAYYVCRAYEVPTDLDSECEIREEFAREIYYPKILELEEQGLLPPIPEE